MTRKRPQEQKFLAGFLFRRDETSPLQESLEITVRLRCHLASWFEIVYVGHPWKYPDKRVGVLLTAGFHDGAEPNRKQP